MNKYDVLIIGGGPAGLAAAESSYKEGAKVLLVEREERLGGILKQCIHDGFGVIKFGEKLSGCEYATREIHNINNLEIDIRLLTFVTNITDLKKSVKYISYLEDNYKFKVDLVNINGVESIFTKTIILATGCRERTAKQIQIHGSRPAGVITAGSAQYYLNIMGQLPGKQCIILGSGDIGLIMARRLTIEGANVLGVYEAKSTPSGLRRNIYQCLDDFNIPLYLSKTVSKVHGDSRVDGVTIVDVDDNMNPIKGTEYFVPCDTLILSVGLIPENELAENIGVEINNYSKGPTCDNNYMTNINGVFSCGNALHVNDLADYVSESGETAGRCAALYAKSSKKSNNINTYNKINISKDFLYAIPHKFDDNAKEITVFFRSREERGRTKFICKCNDETIFEKKYLDLRPPEMEKVVIKLNKISPQNISTDIDLFLTEA